MPEDAGRSRLLSQRPTRLKIIRYTLSRASGSGFGTCSITTLIFCCLFWPFRPRSLYGFFTHAHYSKSEVEGTRLAVDYLNLLSSMRKNLYVSIPLTDFDGFMTTLGFPGRVKAKGTKEWVY